MVGRRAVAVERPGWRSTPAGSPTSAAIPRRARSSGTVSGVSRFCRASPVSSAFISTASSSGRRRRPGAHGGRPAVELACAVAEGLGVAHPQDVGHLRVAGGPEPQLLFEDRPARRALGVGGVRHVGPHGGQLAGGGVTDRHLGEQHGQDGVLPRVEQGEQEALLRAEVGVDGPRRAPGGLGYGVHRHGVDALVGEEVGRGGQQPRPGLRFALLLRPGHVPPGPPRATYLYRKRYATGGSPGEVPAGCPSRSGRGRPGPTVDLSCARQSEGSTMATL